MADVVRQKIGRADSWTAKNPILADGQLGYERDGARRHKIGDGVTPWNDLPYAGGGNSGDDSEAMLALDDHINAAEPHPVYDDGPSFVLLYENAKV